MLLGAVMLKAVQNVNSYQRSSQATIRQGNPATVFFQLVDLDQTDSFGQPLRYIPASGSSVTVTLNSINSANVINRLASQPYSDDRSIFAVALVAADRPSSGNFDITLLESGSTFTTSVANGLIVWTTNQGMC